MPKIDLLPCPFCGSDNIAIIKSKSIDGLFAAECIKCNVSTAFYVNEKFAAETWNTRASGWIPCSERMPEDDEEVLFAVAYPWDKGKKPKVTLGRHYTKNEKGWWTAYYGAFLDYEVTHWMPLPEVPQRKDDTHDYD